jgi:glutamate/tyrosine decarboxylase-like PLP-dependent enzyme
VPYDCGLVILADAAVHKRAMRKDAAYAMSGREGERDSEAFVPEFSRRARATSVYAALRSLGRTGTAELVQGCNALARQFAERVEGHPSIEVANDVVLNQVLLRFRSPGLDEASIVSRLLREIHADGTFWVGRTEWRGRPGLRVSISSWRTSSADVDRAADLLIGLLPEI